MKELAQFVAIITVAAIVLGTVWTKLAVWYKNHNLGPYVLEDLKIAHAALKRANDIIEQLTKKESKDDSNT